MVAPSFSSTAVGFEPCWEEGSSLLPPAPAPRDIPSHSRQQVSAWYPCLWWRVGPLALVIGCNNPLNTQVSQLSSLTQSALFVTHQYPGWGLGRLSKAAQHAQHPQAPQCCHIFKDRTRRWCCLLINAASVLAWARGTAWVTPMPAACPGLVYSTIRGVFPPLGPPTGKLSCKTNGGTKRLGNLGVWYLETGQTHET